MISTKEILQRLGNSQEACAISRERLHKLQAHLIKMYRDIETVCQRHNLDVCLAYGNVIGAMRHGGWIPWDDDLDLHMSRGDYELFLSKYAHELPAQYKVSSYLSEDGSKARFAKILDTSTVLVPLGGERTKDSCVFIDIFPIDNVPKSNVLNKIKRGISFFMMYVAGSVDQVEQNSATYKELMCSDPNGRRNWQIRQFIGNCFKFASKKTWNKWIEQYAINRKKTGYCHVMADLDVCYKKVPYDIYFPFREIELPEIGKIKIPNKYDEYLNLSYTNWRVVPDDNDKWQHYATELYIPD